MDQNLSDLYKIFGKEAQASRTVKLYRLFDLLVNKGYQEPERSGNIGKTTLADFKVNEQLRSRLEDPKWVCKHFKALVQQATLTDIKDTSYTCIAIAKAVDFCDG